MKARTAVAASLTAAGLLLAGCATEITGSAQAATRLPSTESTTTDPGLADESTDSPTPQDSETSESLAPIPPVVPSTESTEAEDTGATTGSDGGALHADSLDWLSSFCYGFDDIMQYTEFDTTGMSDEATLQTIADAYNGMSQAADGAAYQLEVLPPPSFQGADTVAPAIHDWLLSVRDVYGDGAEKIAYGTFETVDDLNATINAIEAGMDGANNELNAAMTDVDPSVKQAIGAMPECATLVG